jgi:hypothetical protein
MQRAAYRLVIRFGRAWLAGPRGLLVDPQRDGVRDQLIAFALAGTGRRRGPDVVRRRGQLRVLGRASSTRACCNKQPGDPPHGAAMVAFSA